MTTRNPYDDEQETTHERPSSFRDMLYRDRRLLSRRQMDRRIRDRVAGRNEENDSVENRITAFPALTRIRSEGPSSEIRAVIFVTILVLAAFFFGRWVGQRTVDGGPSARSGVASVEFVV